MFVQHQHRGISSKENPKHPKKNKFLIFTASDIFKNLKLALKKIRIWFGFFFLPGIAIAGCRAKELVESFDARQSADDVASYLQAHGHRHGRP